MYLLNKITYNEDYTSAVWPANLVPNDALFLSCLPLAAEVQYFGTRPFK